MGTAQLEADILGLVVRWTAGPVEGDGEAMEGHRTTILAKSERGQDSARPPIVVAVQSTHHGTWSPLISLPDVSPSFAMALFLDSPCL